MNWARDHTGERGISHTLLTLVLAWNQPAAYAHTCSHIHRCGPRNRMRKEWMSSGRRSICGGFNYPSALTAVPGPINTFSRPSRGLAVPPPLQGSIQVTSLRVLLVSPQSRKMAPVTQQTGHSQIAAFSDFNLCQIT